MSTSEFRQFVVDAICVDLHDCEGIPISACVGIYVGNGCSFGRVGGWGTARAAYPVHNSSVLCCVLKTRTSSVPIQNNDWLQTTQSTIGGAVTADTSCCANCVEPSRPQQWGPDLQYFVHAGHADPLDGWRCCSQKQL